jgi:ABC-type glycerol-3-phosphate transport system substrate-binding protein
MTTQKFSRRSFMKIAGTATGAAILAGCGAAPTAVVPEATQPVAEQPTEAVVATAEATQPPAEATAVPVAEKTIHRYMCGGYAGAGPDDNLIKDIQEKALLDEYGLNVSIEVESAPWSDIDPLITTRLETQGVDSVERGGSDALNWLSQEGLLQDQEAALEKYGKSLTTMLPSAAFDFFKRDGKRWVFANFYTSPVDCEYIHIRRDWLKKINREIPQTIEELEECLRMFKDQKLGGDVTIPLANDLRLAGSGVCTPGTLRPGAG